MAASAKVTVAYPPRDIWESVTTVEPTLTRLITALIEGMS